MSLRINAGIAKGMLLEVPKSTKITRPTLGQLRQKIFNAYQRMDDFIFVDLFAGTGSMGIEALSMGSPRALFCEFDSRSYGLLKKNLGLLAKNYLLDQSAGESYKYWKMDALKFCSKVLPNELKDQELTTVLFIDPPYEKTELYRAVLEQSKAVAGNIQFWVEADRQKGLNLEAVQKLFAEFNLKFLKSYSQGSSFIAIAEN